MTGPAEGGHGSSDDYDGRGPRGRRDRDRRGRKPKIPSFEAKYEPRPEPRPEIRPRRPLPLADMLLLQFADEARMFRRSDALLHDLQNLGHVAANHRRGIDQPF